MPQPKYKISKYLLDCLKTKVEEKIAFRIFTKLDCRKTSELIQKSSDYTISESTLYRLFLLVENKNTPYLHTLDILSQFIGYKDWFSLEKYFNEISEFQHLYGVFPDQNQYNSLLSFNIHYGGLKPLYHFLEQFPNDLTFDKKVTLGQDIYRSLKTNPTSNLDFYKQFHTLPIIREGFFEIFADPDFSISDYEIGLGYYLKNIKPHTSSKSLQDYVFANSMLLRYYFLNGNKEKVVSIGKTLYLDLPLSEKDFIGIYAFPKMRYFCYKLFFNELTTGFNRAYFEWLINYIHEEITTADDMETRIMIHTICDSLQIYPKLQEEIFNAFFLRYNAFFSKLPTYIFKLPMKERLRFLDQNGATFFGAINQ